MSDEIMRKSLAELRQVFVSAAGDVGRLRALRVALASRQEDWALDFEMEVARAVGMAVKQGKVDSDVRQALLDSAHLPRPDGRPLHRYKMTSSLFEAARAHLAAAHRQGRLDQIDERDAAVFVRYGAEWFRQQFEGGVNKWAHLTAGFGPLPHQIRAALTEIGLAWWRRPIRRINGDREFLMTLRLVVSLSVV